MTYDGQPYENSSNYNNNNNSNQSNMIDGNAQAHSGPAFTVDRSAAPSVYTQRTESMDQQASTPADQEHRPIERSDSSERTLAPRSTSSVELDQPESSSSDSQSHSKNEKSGKRSDENGDEKEDDGWSYAKVLKVSAHTSQGFP